MTSLTSGLRPVLMGGASVAVLAIAVLAIRDGAPPMLDGLTTPVKSDKASVSKPVLAERKSNESPETASRSTNRQQQSAQPVEKPGPMNTLADRNLERDEAESLAAPVSPSASGQIALQPLAKTESRLRADAPAVRALIAPASETMPQPGYQEHGRDRFERFETNPVKVAAEEPVSTFSIDVDTASYAFMRRSLMGGVLPPVDSVRVEEMVNYFPYDYAPPASVETPFATHVAIMDTPWNPDTKLMRIGIQGYELAAAEKPRANLVFLIDTSGSMNAPDKLPLLVNSFRLLLDSLDPDDTVAIVTYAGSAGTVLEPTPVSESARILASLDRLRSGGSTAGAEGIRQAYRLAEQGFDAEGVNRVILATDGDFNVGITDPGQLEGFIERKRESGVFLSVLGFGQGNYNDALMQRLAQNGNGQAAYIDTLSEARKTLVEEAGSALFPIAKDVKIQVEFNPATVAEYRLIGYETRALAREDFNNDKVDAGEIGSGHQVTALYEITPAGSAGRLVDSLRYQSAEPAGTTTPVEDEYAFLKIRYKDPNGQVSKLITTPVTSEMRVEADTIAAREARFAASVAGFGQILRGGEYTGSFGYDEVITLAQGAKGGDPFGYRAEFINLVRLARSAAALETLPRK